MAPPIPGYLEIATKRTFAGAIEWPGWCRNGRDEDEALATLVAYGPRYARVPGGAGVPFEPPVDTSAIEIVERLAGNAGTEFGVPAVPPTNDSLPVNSADLERRILLLQAAWGVFDAAAEAAVGIELRKGPARGWARPRQDAGARSRRGAGISARVGRHASQNCRGGHQSSADSRARRGDSRAARSRRGP